MTIAETRTEYAIQATSFKHGKRVMVIETSPDHITDREWNLDTVQARREWQASANITPDAELVTRTVSITDWTPDPDAEQLDDFRADLVDPNIDRVTLHAYIDANPDWEQYTETGLTYAEWTLDPYSAISIYGTALVAGSDVKLKIPTDAATPEQAREMCIDAAYTINAVALRLPPNTADNVIDRLIAAYSLAEPGSPLKTILTGHTSPDAALTRATTSNIYYRR
jgi:hypothetical protein